MKRVEGAELNSIRQYFDAAAAVALTAQCHNGKCGSVIVKNGVIIGQGYNGPPLNDDLRRTCDNVLNYNIKPKYDKTCCVHAEWRAVLDACKNNADKVTGSVLYFMRVDNVGGYTDAGEPYCTTCSRFTMEAGVGEFALWINGGADVFSLSEYDKKSYSFYAPLTE